MNETFERMQVLDNLKRIVGLEQSKEKMVMAYDSLDSKSDYILENGDRGNGKYAKFNDKYNYDLKDIEDTMNDIEAFIAKIDLEIDNLKKENFEKTGETHEQLMSGLSGKSRDYVLGLEDEETRKSTL